ncbi:4Fe-4S single cluster domain-containing protein, partial [Clostridium sp.]|uniref:4Fe-4S single cluster domain-containing protein n=1 Tax=Clostridium sp. TaxID=1506 RepID=UPI003F3C7CF1
DECFNPDTHDFFGGEECNMDDLINDALDNPIIKGITFSGGDPLERAEEFSYMAKAFKARGLNIWCYSGYTFEHILKNFKNRSEWKELLENIDVLVDGRFDKNKKEDGLRFRGSSNQRIIDVKESLKENKVITLEY